MAAASVPQPMVAVVTEALVLVNNFFTPLRCETPGVLYMRNVCVSSAVCVCGATAAF